MEELLPTTLSPCPCSSYGEQTEQVFSATEAVLEGALRPAPALPCLLAAGLDKGWSSLPRFQQCNGFINEFCALRTRDDEKAEPPTAPPCLTDLGRLV